MQVDKLFAELGTIAMGIVGIAILAVLVSRNAQTPQVLTAAGNSFANAIKAAVSPVGSGFSSSLPSLSSVSAF